MSSTHRFFLKYCGNGHMLYSTDQPPTQPCCERCGETYLDKCPQCEKPFFYSFLSRVYFTSGLPISMPRRPDYCPQCGKPMPWVNKEVQRIEGAGVWQMLHPKVAELAKPRFESGHYADAVEAVFKELNSRVKQIYLKSTGEELDGVPLMRKAFTPSKPVILLDDLSTETGRNIQQGYMEIFAGSMAGIRNPKTHENVVITADRATHHLMLASLLFNRLDERK